MRQRFAHSFVVSADRRRCQDRFLWTGIGPCKHESGRLPTGPTHRVTATSSSMLTGETTFLCSATLSWLSGLPGCVPSERRGKCRPHHSQRHEADGSGVQQPNFPALSLPWLITLLYDLQAVPWRTCMYRPNRLTGLALCVLSLPNRPSSSLCRQSVPGDFLLLVNPAEVGDRAHRAPDWMGCGCVLPESSASFYVTYVNYPCGLPSLDSGYTVARAPYVVASRWKQAQAVERAVLDPICFPLFLASALDHSLPLRLVMWPDVWI